MNKSEVVSSLATKCNIPKSKAEEIVKTLFSPEIGIIAKALKSGDGIAFQGFGTFSVRKRKARKALNPKNGETISVPARKVASFKAGTTLKKTIN